MESFLIAVGSLVPMLLVLVVVHELGHFATARKLGVKVLEFGVGFPPRAFGVYTGSTRVLLDSGTAYLNLDGASSLRRGQFVKLASGEDEDGNLVARIVEAPRTDLKLRDRLPGRGALSEQLGSDELLRHEGKVRSVEDGSVVVADMLYSVNWTPLGGFVRLAGENNPNVPRSLAAKGVGTRFLVLVAGPLMNAILPIAFFTILLMLPQNVEIGQVSVTRVAEGSPAQVAGLREGDIVTGAGGHRIENTSDLNRAVNLNGGGLMPWRIDRGGQAQILQVQPQFSRPEGRWLTGIMIRSDLEGRVVVDNVSKGSPAEMAGLKPDDSVATVDGKPITAVDDLVNAIQLSAGSAMDWGLVRNGTARNVVVAPRFQRPEGEMWLTGASTSLINSESDTRSSPPWIALRDSFVRTWEVLVLLKQGVTGAFSQGAAPQLSGPVGIAQITGEVTREGGLAGWMAITILLSINLAILNILPIPMLDGGRLVFVVLEWVRRGKRVPPEKEGMVHLIGFVVLIGLIVIISANDISRLVQGQSFLGG